MPKSYAALHFLSPLNCDVMFGTKMNPNEIYVLERLQSKFGGEYHKGENPPDAHLCIEDKKIAVEVTRLVEQVMDKKGNLVSRMKHDIPAENLANELNDAMQEIIPNENHVLLILPAPINSIKRTKEKLKSAINDCIRNNVINTDIEIEGNLITIHVYDVPRPSGKKIIGAITNRYSTANISANTKYLLMDRITTKAKKCTIHTNIDEYWLALYNDYWIADEESYRLAYRDIDVKHDFKNIFIVTGYGEVHKL